MVLFVFVGSCGNVVEVAVDVVLVDQALRVVPHVDARLRVPVDLVLVDVRVGSPATRYPLARVLADVIVCYLR